MKSIDELTLKQVEIPCGRSISKDDLEIAERALLKLLHSYTENELKPQLRITLQNEIDRASNQDAAFLLDCNLMKPAELYQLINASNILAKYLIRNIQTSRERRAFLGDLEALEDLKIFKL